MESQAVMKERRLRELQSRREMKRKQKVKRKITSIALTISILGITFGGVLSASAKEITITEINEFENTKETKTIHTFKDNVQKVLDDCDIVVGETDTVNVPLDSVTCDNSELVVKRGRQIKVKTNEGEKIATVTKANVMEALEEAGCEVSDLDEVYPSRTAKLDSNTTPETTIEVVSVENKEEVKTEPIAFETEYIEDDTLNKGESRTVTEGQEGEFKTVESVTYKNGVEIARNKVSEEVSKEPVNKVIANGTKSVSVSSENTAKEVRSMETASEKSETKTGDTGSTINGMSYSRKITMTATAYSTHPSENGGWTVSAMGNPLGHGIVAVDPDVVPLGSKVYVESADGSWVYGVASAEDTGSGIDGNRIDLCYEGSVAEVNKFGVQKCVVYILND